MTDEERAELIEGERLLNHCDLLMLTAIKVLIRLLEENKVDEALEGLEELREFYLDKATN